MKKGKILSIALSVLILTQSLAPSVYASSIRHHNFAKPSYSRGYGTGQSLSISGYDDYAEDHVKTSKWQKISGKELYRLEKFHRKVGDIQTKVETSIVIAGGFTSLAAAIIGGIHSVAGLFKAPSRHTRIAEQIRDFRDDNDISKKDTAKNHKIRTTVYYTTYADIDGEYKNAVTNLVFELK